MSGHKQGPPTVETSGPRPSPEQLERRHRQVLRAFAQTAFACAVIGAGCLLTANHTLHLMAFFLLAWAAGWGCASVYLLARRAVKRIRRRDGR